LGSIGLTHAGRIVAENHLSVVAARHHMVRRPGILNAQRPRHNDRNLAQTSFSRQAEIVTILGLTLLPLHSGSKV
jgi:hypothetical protein